MMYMGSKASIAKYLEPVMSAARRGRPWVEPFVGGGNMIDKIEGVRKGNDTHEPLVRLLEAASQGWIPPSYVSFEQYHHVKSNPEQYRPEFVGFVGFLCSFGGKWWGGYAKNKSKLNYAAVGSRALMRQSEGLRGCAFTAGDYRSIAFKTSSLIYCDPPYEGTSKYKGGFSHADFWQWCRDKSREGHTVFISEYSAPEDFVCVLSVEHLTKMDKNKRSKRIEKLFMFDEFGIW